MKLNMIGVLTGMWINMGILILHFRESVIGGGNLVRGANSGVYGMLLMVQDKIPRELYEPTRIMLSVYHFLCGIFH